MAEPQGEVSDANALDPDALGFMCGIEVHQQLATGKLHSRQPGVLYDVTEETVPDTWPRTRRRLRAARGEGGAVDVAARFEAKRRRSFDYVQSPNAGLLDLVERCPFADGDVPYLARQTVVREQRAVSDRFEREGGLPIRSQAEHEGIVLCKRKRRANPVNLGFRDAVGRKFVAVEDTAYAGEFRGSCELSSEPRQLSTFLIERFGAKQAGQSRK